MRGLWGVIRGSCKGIFLQIAGVASGIREQSVHD